MKRIILTMSVITTCVVAVFADYQPLLVEGRQWNLYERQYAVSVDGEIRAQHTMFQTIRDIFTFEGLTYYKVFNPYLGVEMVYREDVEQQRVYRCIYDQSQNKYNESLLFSFNTNVGDTIISYEEWYKDTLVFVVTKIDSVQGRKRIYVNNVERLAINSEIVYETDILLDEKITEYTDIWIEGIGSLTLLGNRMYEINDPSPAPLPILTCVYDNDSLIFTTPVADKLGCTVIPTIADTWYGLERNYLRSERSDDYTNVTLHLANDTLIDNVNYRQLFFEGEIFNNGKSICIGAVRQTEDGLKVYWHDLNQEHLLYDFSAEVGDTIKDAYFNLMDLREYLDNRGEKGSLGYLVESKKTINGRIHMGVVCCIEHDDGQIVNAYRTKWIQGIGTPNIIWPHDYGYYGTTTLWTLCAAKGDETLYTYDTRHLGIENNCPDWELINDNVEDVTVSSYTEKILDNDQIFIILGGKRYNLLGTEIK